MVRRGVWHDAAKKPGVGTCRELEAEGKPYRMTEIDFMIPMSYCLKTAEGRWAFVSHRPVDWKNHNQSPSYLVWVTT
ncbi:hypothetical protein ACFFX1_21270 [Dactylosporangium sucinum]|nr:hypothetical protein [Dactylosporangium sucinum]